MPQPTAAQSVTRKAPRRTPRLSKVTNARDALAEFDRGMETYCLTFGQFSRGDRFYRPTLPQDVPTTATSRGSVRQW